MTALKGSSVNFKNGPDLVNKSSEGRVKYLLGQYQSCNGTDVRNFVDILFYTETADDGEQEELDVDADNEEFSDLEDETVSGTKFNTESTKSTSCSEDVLGSFPHQISELLEAINKFDQIFETVARDIGDVLQRTSGCFICKHNRLGAQLSSHQKPQQAICSHDQRDQKRILKLVERGGNFKDFEDLVLKEDENSKVYLDGALRITRTSYKGEFRCRGRLSRYTDFNDIAEHFKENMV